MSYTGKRVLVTGAGGFIGSHLAERLVTLGAETRAMVHYNALGSQGWLDHSPLVGQMEVIAGDVRDRDSVRDAMQGVDVVLHLAALISIPYSYHAPESFVATNTVGTLNVLRAAREMGVSRVVVTSTSETYGSARYWPMDEAHPLCAQSVYSASKVAADALAQSFYRAFGLPVVVLRPFNTFGPRQSTRAIIPTIITQLLAGPVVRLGSLSPVRDLNYVANTVEGFILAGTCEAVIGKTINIGSGQGISIGALAMRIAALMERPLRIETDSQRVRPESSEVDRLICDSTLARSLLGWEPAVSLDEGLRRTIEWMREHADVKRAAAYAV